MRGHNVPDERYASERRRGPSTSLNSNQSVLSWNTIKQAAQRARAAARGERNTRDEPQVWILMRAGLELNLGYADLLQHGL